jgi:hypothetical protein
VDVKKEENQANGSLPQQMRADNPGHMPKIKRENLKLNRNKNKNQCEKNDYLFFLYFFKIKDDYS